MKDRGEKSVIRPGNHSVSFFIGRETKKLNKMLVTLTAMNIHRQTLEKLLTLETLSSRDPIRRIAMWFFQRQFDLKWIYRAHFKLIFTAAAHWRTILKEIYLQYIHSPGASIANQKLGGQVLMRRLLFCQNLGGQLPTLPTGHWHPWIVYYSAILKVEFLSSKLPATRDTANRQQMGSRVK